MRHRFPLQPAFLACVLCAVALAVAGHSLAGDVSRQHVVLKRGYVPGSAKVLTCDDLPNVCKNRRRFFLKKKERWLLPRMKMRGCTVRHTVGVGVSLSCPQTVSATGTHSERIFRMTDLISATQIRAPEAWSAGVQGDGVRVAVLDTGVEATHPGLLGRVVLQEDFTGSGPNDSNGHGTHIAGIIAGLGSVDVNGKRAQGVAPGAQILAGKVCSDEGWCGEGDILAGLEWAALQGAQVINLSLGGGSFDGHCDDDTLAQTVNGIVAQGVVVVAASGNGGAGVGTPACASRAIAVGAVDVSDVRASWSNFGAALDLVAPGVGIFSLYSCVAAGTCPDSSYAELSGTSMAAPHVAGVVALLLSRDPSLTPDAVTVLLTSTAKDLGTSGFDALHGYGRIDALAAVQAVSPLTASSSAISSQTPSSAVVSSSISAHSSISSTTSSAPEQPFCRDDDGDGVASCRECDDSNPFVFPGNTERCNGSDDNCDGRTDEGCEAARSSPPSRTVCGNAICEGTENRNSCPSDCTSVVPPRAEERSGGRAGGDASGEHREGRKDGEERHDGSSSSVVSRREEGGPGGDGPRSDEHQGQGQDRGRGHDDDHRSRGHEGDRGRSAEVEVEAEAQSHGIGAWLKAKFKLR